MNFAIVIISKLVIITLAAIIFAMTQRATSRAGAKRPLRMDDTVLLRASSRIKILTGAACVFIAVVAAFTITVGLFSAPSPGFRVFLLILTVLIPTVCGLAFLSTVRRSVLVSSEGIHSESLFGKRMVLYEDIKQIQQHERDWVVIKTNGKGRVLISKYMEGWMEAVALIERFRRQNRDVE